MAKLLLMRVKELRIELDLTQEEFAKKAGFGYKYYQAVEAGRKQDIRFSTVEKMAKACGLEVWELLKFDTKPKPTQQKVRRPWGHKIGYPKWRAKSRPEKSAITRP